MIKRLIFDIDGTLIRGVSFHPAIAKTLHKLGYYTEGNVKLFMEVKDKYEEEYSYFDRGEYIKYLNKHLNIALDDSFFLVFFEELRKCIPNNNKNLKKVLEDLAKKYELVILSNYFEESQMNRLSAMGIGHLFLEYYGEDIMKPSDDAYLRACGNHETQECLMIGDDPYLDIRRARDLGFKTIFINSKGLKNVDSDITLESVEDISINLIEKLIK